MTALTWPSQQNNEATTRNISLKECCHYVRRVGAASMNTDRQGRSRDREIERDRAGEQHRREKDKQRKVRQEDEDGGRGMGTVMCGTLYSSQIQVIPGWVCKGGVSFTQTLLKIKQPWWCHVLLYLSFICTVPRIQGHVLFMIIDMTQ